MPLTRQEDRDSMAEFYIPADDFAGRKVGVIGWPSRVGSGLELRGWQSYLKPVAHKIGHEGDTLFEVHWLSAPWPFLWCWQIIILKNQRFDGFFGKLHRAKDKQGFWTFRVEPEVEEKGFCMSLKL